MVSPLDGYQQCCQRPWLTSTHGSLCERFNATFNRRYESLSRWQRQRGPKILLAEQQPAEFLASFLAACAAQCPLFLANPRWRDDEWRAALALAQPDIIWRDGETILPAEGRPSSGVSSSSRYTAADSSRPQSSSHLKSWIMIPTGGSTGKLKFAIHTWATLSASVQGFRQYFGCRAVNACCTLPLYHVSGLMQAMRCLLSGGNLVLWPWRLLADLPPEFPSTNAFVSLVPSQLRELMTDAAAVTLLRRFCAVLVGGAPAWPALLDQGRSLRLPLAPTYGMTETASQVATLRPEDFLAGQTGCGPPLPHASLDIVDAQGNPTAEIGRIAITCRSLYLGYYPNASNPTVIETDDLGYLTPTGLQVVGRQSDKIISGGENIFPAEVEAAILATGLVQDVAVIGIGDSHWGETPVALYVPRAAGVASPYELRASLASRLSRYKHPSRWIPLAELPRNSQGKLDRVALRAIAARGDAPIPD